MKKHGPWTIKESRERFQGKMFRVFEDEVIRPDGTDGTYATIHINPGVETLALDADDLARDRGVQLAAAQRL